MLEVIQNFSADIETSPQWVILWVRFLGLMMALSIPFAFVNKEARLMVLVAAVTMPLILWLYSIFGYQRILGLAHIVAWTPYVIYLWARRSHWRVTETFSGKYIALLFIVLCISLVMDYTDVFRYFLGERF